MSMFVDVDNPNPSLAFNAPASLRNVEYIGPLAAQADNITALEIPSTRFLPVRVISLIQNIAVWAAEILSCYFVCCAISAIGNMAEQEQIFFAWRADAR